MESSAYTTTSFGPGPAPSQAPELGTNYDNNNNNNNNNDQQLPQANAQPPPPAVSNSAFSSAAPVANLPDTNSGVSVLAQSATTTRAKQTKRIIFPVKLFDMLSRPDCSEIILWAENGRAWKVLNPKELERILPNYFKHSSFLSFSRQVQLWDFRRIKTGPYKGFYYHPLFLRDRPGLCKQMQRKPTKSSGSGPVAEPDFYALEENAANELANATQGLNPVGVPTAPASLYQQQLNTNLLGNQGNIGTLNHQALLQHQGIGNYGAGLLGQQQGINPALLGNLANSEVSRSLLLNLRLQELEQIRGAIYNSYLQGGQQGSQNGGNGTLQQHQAPIRPSSNNGGLSSQYIQPGLQGNPILYHQQTQQPMANENQFSHLPVHHQTQHPGESMLAGNQGYNQNLSPANAENKKYGE